MSDRSRSKRYALTKIETLKTLALQGLNESWDSFPLCSVILNFIEKLATRCQFSKGDVDDNDANEGVKNSAYSAGSIHQIKYDSRQKEAQRELCASFNLLVEICKLQITA